MPAQNPGDCEYGNFWHAGDNNPGDCEWGVFWHIGGAAAPVAGQIYTKVAGTWETVHTVWYKDAGVWKKAKVYAKVAGVWIEIYDGT
jgi:hypothetical protein